MRLLIAASLAMIGFGCTSIDKPKPEAKPAPNDTITSGPLGSKASDDQQDPRQRVPEKFIKYERLNGYIGP